MVHQYPVRSVIIPVMGCVVQDAIVGHGFVVIVNVGWDVLIMMKNVVLVIIIVVRLIHFGLDVMDQDRVHKNKSLTKSE